MRVSNSASLACIFCSARQRLPILSDNCIDRSVLTIHTSTA